MDLKRYGLRKKGENCKNGWLGLSHLMKSLMATDVLICLSGFLEYEIIMREYGQ